MDDYGHTPAQIKTTLAGLREFYPGRRLIISFMSHTYTRTAAMLDEFAASFEEADIVLLHKIYSSAREVYHGGVTGKTLYDKAKELLDIVPVSSGTAKKEERIFYFHEVEEGAEFLKDILRPGDLFITMGAGDNWRLGKLLFTYYRERETK